MASASPETNNNPNWLAYEQQNFEAVIQFFSDPEQRQALKDFDQLSSDGVSFATPGGSFVRIGSAHPSAEHADNVEFNVAISHRDQQGVRHETTERRITLPKRFVDLMSAGKDGAKRQVIYDFKDLKDVPADKLPEDARWLMSHFNNRLVVARDAENAITRLENEEMTLGFDSENVTHLADVYRQGVEHNQKENVRVAEEQADAHFASIFSLMGLRNRLWLKEGAEIARRKGKHAKADRIEARIEVGRQNRIDKYKRWIDEADSVPAIPEVRRYRR